MKMKTNTEKTESIYRGLVTIVTPITIQYLMSSLVSASDAFMLGFLDQDSLSASSLATQVAFVFSLFYGAFISGFNVLAAQYYGKKDHTSVRHILTITLRYALLVGLLFSAATFFFPRQLMHFFTNEESLIEIGAKYLRAVSLSYVLTGFTQVYLGCMKVVGKASLSSVIGSAAVVVNIILNALLIFGLLGFPRLGIVGAALATVIARVVELLCIIVVLIKKMCPAIVPKELFHMDAKILHRDYWKYTLPLLINQIGWGGGVTMYSVIMGHLGNDAVAANSIATIVRSMIASFCWGVAAGVSIMLGNMLGAGELEKARRAGGKFVRLSIWIGVISGLVILAFLPLVLHLMTTLSDQAHEYLKGMLLFASYYIIGNSLNSTIIAGIFPAGGDTKFGMICDVVTLWAVIVPIGFLAAFVWKLPVMWVAFILTLDEFVKIPAVYIHYKKYRWVKNITREF